MLAALDTRDRPGVVVAAVVGTLVLADAALVAYFGLRMHGLVIFDEKFAVEGARWLHGGLHRLVETPSYGDRGIERLTAVLCVPAIWLFGSTAHQFVFDHLLMSLLYALQAVPAFMLARGLGARLGWALFAASFAVAGPWAVFGTIFLNNAPAACAAAFALWAMWRAVTTPSAWWDALAVALVGVAALARVSTAVLIVALPIAIVTHAIVAREGRSWPRVAALTARRHWLLIAVLALGAFVVADNGSRRLLGHYADASVGFHLNVIGNRVLISLAHLGAGAAVIPLVVALAWVLAQLVRPSSPPAHAFAMLALVWFAALLWVNMASGIDERYELPLFVPLAVAFAVALGRRELKVAPAVAAGLLCWYALHRHGDIGFAGSSDYVTWPSREWLARVWLNKAQYNLHFDRKTALDLIGVAAVAAAIGLARLRGRWSGRLNLFVAAFTLVFAFAGSIWAMQKLSDAERPSASFAGMSFIDAVTKGQVTEPVGSTVETDAAVPQGWSEVQFFNASVQRPISLEGKVYDLCCPPQGIDQVAQVNHATGALSSDLPLPPYVATIPQWLPAGFAGTTIFASSAYSPPIRVERLRRPPMAAWLSTGFDYYGWLRPRQHTSLRVFPRAAPSPSCLRLTLHAPTAKSPTRWAIGGSKGRLGPGASQRLELPLHGAGPVDLPVTASPPGPDPVTGKPGLIGLSDLSVVTCGSPEVQPKPAP